jgi:hypothetical protein
MRRAKEGVSTIRQPQHLFRRRVDGGDATFSIDHEDGGELADAVGAEESAVVAKLPRLLDEADGEGEPLLAGIGSDLGSGARAPAASTGARMIRAFVVPTVAGWRSPPR